MIIDRLRCFSVTYPIATGSYRMSGGRVLTELVSSIVEVSSNDGVTGYGEACTLGSSYIDGFSSGVLAGVRELAESVLNSDPLEPNVVNERMDDAVIGNLAAKAAIDAAVWDLRGTVLDQPVCVLLGGRHQERYPVFHPLSLADPQAMAEDATARAADGYRHWQLKLGDDPRQDAHRVRAAHEAIVASADVITCDANRGWVMADALRYLHLVNDLDIYVEQPCQTIEELAQLRRNSILPFVADEAVRDVPDLVRCVTSGAAEVVNIKPARVGGITKAARLRDVAVALGMKVIIDEPMGGELAVAGISQLAASTPKRAFLTASHITATHIRRGDQPWILGDGVPLENGFARAPSRPGLGLHVAAEQLGPPLIDMRS